MKKIMIVEDHEGMRILYKAVFAKEKEMKIMHMTDSGEDALKLINENRPELIIVDLSLPEMDGIEFTKLVKNKYRQIKILIVSGYEPERYFEAAREAGADSLTTKGDIYEIITEVKKLLGSE